jgi:hypothetical protein
MMKAMTALNQMKNNAFFSEIPKDVEKCVICGRVTDIPIRLPISKRKTYMPAAGHLCEGVFPKSMKRANCYFCEFIRKLA